MAVSLLTFLCAAAAVEKEPESCAAPPRSGATVRAVRTVQWTEGFDAATLFAADSVEEEPVPVLLQGAPTAALLGKWDAAYLSTLSGEAVGAAAAADVLSVRVQPSPLFMYHDRKKQLLGFRERIESENAADPSGAKRAATLPHLAPAFETVQWPARDLYGRIFGNATQDTTAGVGVDEHAFYSEGGALEGGGALALDVAELLPGALFLRCGALPATAAHARKPCEEKYHLWTTSAGATTAAHFDVVHNANLLLVGRKRWLLVAPADLPDAYVNAAISPQQIMSQMLNPLTLEGQDPGRFPAFCGASPPKQVWEAEQRPGDILYLPRHWMHHVATLEPTLALNNWPTWAREADVEDKFYAALTGDGALKGDIMRALGKVGQKHGPRGIDKQVQLLVGHIVAGAFRDGGGSDGGGQGAGSAGGGAPWCPGGEAEAAACVRAFTERHLAQRYAPWLDVHRLLPSFRIECAPLAQRLAEPTKKKMASLVSRSVAVFRELPLHIREHTLRDWIENLLSTVRAIKRFREIPFFLRQCLH
jgi:hypothetical protein